MWVALTKLYHSSNEDRKMLLRKKIYSIKMVKDEGVEAFLSRISQVRDKLASFRDNVFGSELV